MKLPPGPRRPALLQTLRWLRAPYEFMDKCAARFGSIFRFHISGYATVVVLDDPELVKDLFAQSGDHLSAGKANISAALHRSQVWARY